MNAEVAELQRPKSVEQAAAADQKTSILISDLNGSDEQAVKDVMVNIEIDGPHHNQARKRRFCQLRDNYLARDHGVLVLRLDVMTQRGWSEAQKVAHIRERLRQLPVHLPGLGPIGPTRVADESAAACEV